MSSGRSRTLLCVGNFDRQTGYAWATIRRVWEAVATELKADGIRTLVVYRQQTGAADVGRSGPLEELPGGWSDWNDLAELCRRHSVDGCWLTDQPLIDRRYRMLRSAGVSFLVMHARSSGSRSSPTGLKRRVKTFLGQRPAWTADRYVAISDFVKRRLLESGRLPADKVIRIHNAIDVTNWAAAVDAVRVRTELDLDPAARLVVCACRAQAYKGVGTLIEAFAQLPERDAAGAPIIGLHCGAGPDLERFRETLAAHGLTGRFRLLGKSDRVRELVAASDVAVVPSQWEEGFGLSVAEAMAARRPVVASRVGAIPELIEHERTGLLVQPADPAELAASIGRLLADDALSERLGSNAQAVARERFDLPRLQGELARLFLEGLAAG